MKVRRLTATFAMAPLIAAAASLPAQAGEKTERVTSARQGATLDVLMVEPPGRPRAAVLMFIGGWTGNLAETRNNFLLRTRERLAAAGLLLAFPDVPSDRKDRGLGNFRSLPGYAQDIRAVVNHVTAHAGVPVFAIGTSRGSVSAANVAARLGPQQIAGVALTSSVTRTGQRGQNSIHDAPLADIRVPVLIMHHRDDACHDTPASDAPALVVALPNAPRKETKILLGGQPPRSGPCDARSAHGYFGIEDDAANAMIEWIDGVLAAKS